MPSPDESASISAWLEAIHQAIKDHAESVAKYQHSEQSDRQQQAQIGINTVVRLPVEASEYYRAEQGERPVKNLYEKIRICLEIAGVVTAIALAILTFKTLLVFNGQLTEMQKQSTILQQQAIQSASDFAQQLTIARQQTEAAQESVMAIQRQMRQDQRAWIDIEFGTFHWAPNEPLRVPFTLVNTGRTPARDVKGTAVVEKIARGQKPNFGDSRKPVNDFGNRSLFPNSPEQNFGFQSLQYKANTKEIGARRMSAADIAEITTGRAYIAVHGMITCQDIFKTRHWLKYCGYSAEDLILVQDSIKACTDYNDVDDN